MKIPNRSGMLVLIVALIFSVLTTGMAAQEGCDPNLNHLADGQALYESGDYSGAIAAFTCAIPGAPVTAYNGIGNSYRQLGDFQQAAESYTGALAVDPENAVILNNRGWAYYQLGQYSQALDDLNQAILIDPLLPHPYNNRGLVYARLNEFELALSDFSEALALGYPDETSLRANETALREALYEMVDQADSSYSWGTRAATELYNRGTQRALEGDLVGALVDLSQSLERDPSIENTWNNRGVIYDMIGDYELAIADFTQALELNPTMSDCFCPPYATNRGWSYFQLGDYDAALADFQYALEHRPEEGFTYLLLALTYFELGQENESAETIERWLEHDESRHFTYVPLELDRGLLIHLERETYYHVPFEAEAGQIVTISVQDNDGELQVDPQVALLDPDNVVVAYNDDHLGLDSLIRGVELAQDGTYTLIVTHAGSGAIGAVTVLITESPD